MSAEQVVRDLVARVWNAGRWQELDGFFADPFDHAGHSEGVAELRAWHEADAATWAESRYEIVAVVCDGEQVALRWRASARQIGQWGPVPATGRRVAWDGVHFFVVRGGRIVSMWALADMFGKAHQLGVGFTSPA